MVGKLIRVGGGILGGGDDFGRNVLLELDHRRLMDHHKVQILAAGGLHKAALPLIVCGQRVAGTGGDELAGLQRQLGIEPALGNVNYPRETTKHLAALSSVHILHQTVEGGGNKEVPIVRRNLVLVHLRDGGAQSSHHVRAGGQSAGNLCNTSLCGIAGKPERIQLRGHLIADELPGQIAEGLPRRLQIVHGVHVEHPGAVVVAGNGLVSQGYVSLHIAAAPVVIAKSLKVHDGDNQLPPVGPLTDQIGVAVQNRSQGGKAVGLVQERNEFFGKCDVVHNILLNNRLLVEIGACGVKLKPRGAATSLQPESPAERRTIPAVHSSAAGVLHHHRPTAERARVILLKLPPELPKALEFSFFDGQIFRPRGRKKRGFCGATGKMQGCGGLFQGDIVACGGKILTELGVCGGQCG